MGKHPQWSALGLAAVLAGCSPGPIIDRLPTDLGLPAGTPARPAAPYEYPAVHDMPPDRATSPMSEEEQVRLEKELASVRDRQEGRQPAAKKGSPPAKKSAKDAKNGQADGAKANHLAYLGDATVGERVNYGAGSITANYDGANKHRTVIEADVHVGSNCVLVAPVTIGAGGTVGAGSVVTRNAEPGSLTVARGKQVNLPNWKRPTKEGSKGG